MIMKTSVLLSWEFPDNYNSPTPYKVRPLPPAREQAGQVRGWGLAGVGNQLDSALSGIRAQLGLRLSLWSRLNLGLGLSLRLGVHEDWGSFKVGSQSGQGSAGLRICLAGRFSLGSRFSLRSELSLDWDTVCD